MSSLLDEAIVDAKALREAVLKNAEASLLEAYAPKIEETVARLLEQDPVAGMGVGPMDIGAPPADIGAPPGGLGTAPEPEHTETGATFTLGEEEDLDIDYGALSELDDNSKLDDVSEIDITRGELQAMLESITKDIETLEEEMDDDTIPKPMDEGDIEIDEDILETFELDESMLTEESVHHVVKAGDTLSAIAKDHEVTVKDIMDHGRNNIKSAGDIKVGQKIFIPMHADDRPGNTTKEGQESTEKYDDNPALEGDQDELPDALQKGIIQAKEGLSLSEESIDEIVESLVVDIMPAKSGWAGTPESVMQYNEKLAAVMAQSDKYKEEKDELLKVGQSLQESLGKHQTVNAKLKEVVDALKEKLDEVNLTNAKLLYTNRILRKSSLNERQKNKIVEALSSAGSVNEAKVLYETLQDAVGSSRKSGPQSLSEAVSRPSTILPRRKVQDNDSNSFTDRMKMLAGIKN